MRLHGGIVEPDNEFDSYLHTIFTHPKIAAEALLLDIPRYAYIGNLLDKKIWIRMNGDTLPFDEMALTELVHWRDLAKIKAFTDLTHFIYYNQTVQELRRRELENIKHKRYHVFAGKSKYSE